MSRETTENLVVSKPAWASKGVIGSVVVMLVGVLGIARLFIPALRDVEIDSGALAGIATSALTLIFGALSLVGRWKAERPIHIINRRTVPGGPFNPDAEVRRAERVHKGRGGFVRPIFLAGVILLLLCAWFLAAAVAQVGWRVTRYDQAAERCGGMTYDTWMRYTPPVDQRPFLLRLWDSLACSVSPRIATDERGHLRVAPPQIQITGGTDF